MKRIIKLVVFALCISHLIAQEPVNPAAKSHYKSLKKLLEKVAARDWTSEINLVERDLNVAAEKVALIEKYEPGFSYLEKDEYNKLQKKFDYGKNAGIAQSNDSYLLKKELDEFFKSPYTYALGKEDPKGFYESFKSRAEQYKNDNSKDKYKEAPDNLKNEAKGFDVVTKDIESSINDSGGEEQATMYFYRTKVYIEYWNLALYFEPGNTLYAENLKAINATAVKIGSLESIKSNIAKKAKERADKKQMPAAVRKDADLESKIKQSFMAISKARGWSIEITKVNIITSDWAILRDKYTNAITRRSQSASIAAKKDGKCIVYDFVNYYQQYDGSKYIGGECGNDYQWPEEINCSNISK